MIGKASEDAKIYLPRNDFGSLVITNKNIYDKTMAELQLLRKELDNDLENFKIPKYGLTDEQYVNLKKLLKLKYQRQLNSYET